MEKYDISNYEYPKEYISENNQNGYINIDIDPIMLKPRSFKYPDNECNYLDTTQYDHKNNILDLGYQRLRQINIKMYPQFKTLVSLFIDHNMLQQLPEPEYLPNIEYLTCQSNKLTKIPYYPKLKFLDISDNCVSECNQYSISSLTYFDWSKNGDVNVDFIIPHCEQLYLSNNRITSINLNNYPKLQLLDCSGCGLKYLIGQSDKLTELDAQNNSLSNIPHFKNIRRIVLDYNKLEKIDSYPQLSSLSISFNNVTHIGDQPKLKKLLANNNKISYVGNMPCLKMIDLGHNKLTSYNPPVNTNYLSIHFNPITDIRLDGTVVKSIKELQVNFKTYKNIYNRYYDVFESVNIQSSQEKMKLILEKIKDKISIDLTNKLFAMFKKIKFHERDVLLKTVCADIYIKNYCKNRTEQKNNDKIYTTVEYKQIHDLVSNIYYKTLIITLYFNSYRN